MDIADIRKANLKALMDARFGAGKRGAQTRMANLLGRQQDYISRCLAPTDRKHSKNIGEDFAREIEERLGLERYELDDPELRVRAGQDRGDLPAVASVTVGGEVIDAAGSYCDLSPGHAEHQVTQGDIDRDLLAEIIERVDASCMKKPGILSSREKAAAIAGAYCFAATARTSSIDLQGVVAVAIETAKDQALARG